MSDCFDGVLEGVMDEFIPVLDILHSRKVLLYWGGDADPRSSIVFKVVSWKNTCIDLRFGIVGKVGDVLADGSGRGMCRY
jgi:hypothetical protein